MESLLERGVPGGKSTKDDSLMSDQNKVRPPDGGEADCEFVVLVTLLLLLLLAFSVSGSGALGGGAAAAVTLEDGAGGITPSSLLGREEDCAE